MDKVIEVLKIMIKEKEDKLKLLREVFDQVDANDFFSQGVVAQNIANEARELESLQRSLENWGKK